MDMIAEHELLRVHLGIIDNNESIIESGLARLERMAQDLHRKDIKLYCAYLYLKGLWASNSDERDECIKRYASVMRIKITAGSSYGFCSILTTSMKLIR